MLDKDDFRVIIEDTRTRHAAVVALIYFTDGQAMALLRLYVTLGIATASGAAAGFSGTLMIPRPVGWALAVATVVLTVGAAFCLRAMQSGAISLPGRRAGFWQWAITPEVTRDEVLRGYLENLVAKTAQNDALNARTAKAHAYAKRCSVMVPIAALAAGLVTLVLRV
jgi:hypothetical protein